MSGPRFIAPDRHRRGIAAVRAMILLRQQFGHDAFVNSGPRDLTCPAALDTTVMHGPCEDPSRAGWHRGPLSLEELFCDDCGHVETIPSHDDRPPRCENCGSTAVERRPFGTAPAL